MSKKLLFGIILLSFLYTGILVSFSTYRVENKGDVKAVMSVNVKDFGAVGNGTNNDTVAIQNAINSLSGGGEVYIPAGTYMVKNLQYKQGISIRGDGSSSILKADKSMTTWQSVLYCENITGIKIDGVTFDGNKGVVGGDATAGIFLLQIKNSSDVSVVNSFFQHNWYVGIAVKKSNNLYFYKNNFLDIDCGIITAEYPSNNIVIDNNYFDGAKMSEPISIYGMNEGYHNNITITNNVIKNHTWGSGICIRATKTAVVKNNTIDNCGTGLYTERVSYNGVNYGVSDLIFENNTITNSVYEGIKIQDLSDSHIIGNTISRSGTFGFYIDDAKTTEISNNIIEYSNRIDNTTIGGIFINGLNNSVVSSNRITVDSSKYYKSQIYLNGETFKIEGNTFNSNIGSPANISVYGMNQANVGSNTFSSTTTTPTIKPTTTPTVKPTSTPTIKPTATPTVKPTSTPTIKPTTTPTVKPTTTPTVKPTSTPMVEPTVVPKSDTKYYKAEYWNYSNNLLRDVAFLTPPKITSSIYSVNFGWGYGSPNPSINKDKFLVRLTGKKYFTDGDYTFKTLSDDGIRLWVDNKLIIDNWTDHPATLDYADIHLNSGNHIIKIMYYENGGVSTLRMVYRKK